MKMNSFENGLLKYLSPAQLARIQSVKIGLGGAGGLGSNIAAILVRSGFKHWEFLDRDAVEPSNLNRQNYSLCDIGKPKVDVLKQSLIAINPALEIIAHQTSWSESNAKQFFQDCQFVVEAFDAAQDKKLFVEYYQDKTLYVVSGNGMAGVNNNRIETLVLGNVYLVGDFQTDIADGHPPMAPRVIQCAAQMAGIILELTLNRGTF